MEKPAAETAVSLLFECLFLAVNPSSEARLPAGRQIGNPSGILPDIHSSQCYGERETGLTEIWKVAETAHEI
jgi:hypothetical protein